MTATAASRCVRPPSDQARRAPDRARVQSYTRRCRRRVVADVLKVPVDVEPWCAEHAKFQCERPRQLSSVPSGRVKFDHLRNLVAALNATEADVLRRAMPSAKRRAWATGASRGGQHGGFMLADRPIVREREHRRRRRCEER